MLKVEGLTKQYKDFTLQPVNFALPKGYVLGIIGKNGAGKTTLLKSILHQFHVDGGSISYEGKDWESDPISLKQKIGFLSQEAPFLWDVSLYDNADIFGGFYPEFSMERFQKYLHAFSLYEEQIYGECSKGMRIKFQLAFMLSHKPRLILMDEPTAGLDAAFRTTFLSILQDYIEKEMATVLFSTHITDDLDKIADYILILSEGKMVSFDAKENMLDNMKLVSGKEKLFFQIEQKNFYGIRKHHDYICGLTIAYDEIKSQAEELQLGVSRPNLEQILYFISMNETKAGNVVKEKKSCLSSLVKNNEKTNAYSWQHQKEIDDKLLMENSSGKFGLVVLHIILFFLSIYLTVQYFSEQDKLEYYLGFAVGALTIEWTGRNVNFVKGFKKQQNILELYSYYPVVLSYQIKAKIKRIFENTIKQMILMFFVCLLLCIRLGIWKYLELIIICGCNLFALQFIFTGFELIRSRLH